MDVREALLLVVGHELLRDELEGVKAALRDRCGSDPMGTLLEMVVVGSALFLQAERGQNPKVQSISDALVFVSTSLSVGYSDIFPKTEQGKLIATVLQMFGPALTAQALDSPHIASNRYEADSLDAQKDLGRKLDAILEELRARPLATR